MLLVEVGGWAGVVARDTSVGLAKAGELRHTCVVKKTQTLIPEDTRTRGLVARAILENGPMTAVVLAQRLSLTPAGIRRHLDHLVSDGILEAREPHLQSSRGRGRPSKVFVMTDSGREKFEHSYDDLAVSALKFLAAQTSDASLVAFAESRALDMERKVNASIKSGKKSVPISLAVTKALTAQGYAATLMQRDQGEEICQHHCPIAHVAAEFPQLCEAETEALSRLLGTHVQRLATIAHGDGVCTTYIPKNSLTNQAATRGNR